MNDPRREAQRAVGDAYDVRVLEPSPPAVQGEPFSDDPTARGEVAPGRPVLSPVTNGDATWDDFCRAHDDFSEWCAERWLGAWRRLRPLPALEVLHGTRESWHALAEWVVSTARHRANGKIGLRWTRGGFGTPFFGNDEQVRVIGRALVHETIAAAPVATIGEAASLLGLEPAIPGGLFEPSTEPEKPLAIEPVAASALSDWYGFATSVLAQLRVDFEATSPSLIQLWPEHFDIATDLGAPRANYGASPGDAEHPEPYLYVGPWDTAALDRDDGYWNEPFGASRSYATVIAAADQRGGALEFFRAGAARLGRAAR